jgi:DNA-nicking Smr family endonuclease
MKRRKLSEDDLALWSKVAATAVPIRTPSKLLPAEKPVAKGGPRLNGAPRPMEPVRNGKRPQTNLRVAASAPEVHERSPHLDQRTFDRFRKGKMTPERRIDLHGMTLGRAHAALRSFILGARAEGLRMVLVITGKGQRSGDPDAIIPGRKGVLRSSLPVWLNEPSLRPLILEVVPAQLKDGGSGAFYVYLKRAR